VAESRGVAEVSRAIQSRVAAEGTRRLSGAGETMSDEQGKRWVWFFRYRTKTSGYLFMSSEYDTTDMATACGWLEKDHGINCVFAKRKQLTSDEYEALALFRELKFGLRSAICGLFFRSY
jgi:hypothetical protein